MSENFSLDSSGFLYKKNKEIGKKALKNPSS